MNTLDRIEHDLEQMPEHELEKVLAYVESLMVAHRQRPAAEELTPEEDEAVAHWNCS
ncbi:MAG: hypothetical protein JNL98_04320 [Bryobacterales bacterium]|nr:hypothetical protein [Bryobacterales bacterium]